MQIYGFPIPDVHSLTVWFTVFLSSVILWAILIAMVCCGVILWVVSIVSHCPGAILWAAFIAKILAAVFLLLFAGSVSLSGSS